MHIDERRSPGGASDEQSLASVLFLHGGNVAGWMWDEQADALPAYHALIPDLPGFGNSNDEPWAGMPAVADELARRVRERAVGGRVHIVGLSLGGILGLTFCARHPDLVRSAFLSGVTTRPIRGLVAVSARAQVSLWGWRGYWQGLARAYGMPADALDRFVETGLGIDKASARRMMNEVYRGMTAQTLESVRDLQAPVLAVAGEREPAVIRDSLADVARYAPAAQTALVPRMHHVWSAEDPELFHRTLRHWLETATVSPELIPHVRS